MGWIGVERLRNITPRASGQTSIWSFITRELGQPLQERRQMTAVATLTGALSADLVAWHTIDWYAVHRTVRGLQGRIVKAVQAGRWGKVHALQHLLTHSFSGKALAVQRVTTNDGRKTPGVDGVVWDTPEKKACVIGALRQRGYHALPLRRIYIPKKDGTQRQRPLSIPTMHDRAMQALYLLALDPIAETLGDPNSYGFRTERSTADAIEQCFNVLARQHSPQWILEGDIRACFDGISHDWLLAHIPMETAMLQKWLKAGFMEKHILYPTETGVPQGGIASPVIANLALDGLEKLLKAHYPPNTKRAQRAKVNLVRYCDDFITTGSSYELLEHEVKPLVAQFLGERGLELSPTKTHLTSIEDGFDFLGQHLRKYAGKLLIKPARKNIKTFLGHVREVVKANKQTTTGNLIAQLNPMIRGWANYHRHVVSKVVFHQVDTAIFKCLWSWATRRHPKKSRRWVAKKYFRTHHGRQWTFVGTGTSPQKQPDELVLFRAGDVLIQRHVKIKGTANPYDPQWAVYFEARLGVKMTHTLKGRRQLLYLWKHQHGLCPVCHQKITRLTGWHNHHVIWRTHGGRDTTDNRVLLHPNCHRQVHSQALDGAPSRSIRSV
jgi:RNA-directed DNA polymerase